MYLEHFGLKELPFSLTPDTEYFFSYGHYADALNTLLVALRTGEGFIKVTGEVGTGKTLLCRKLLNTLEDKFVTAYIPNPMVTPYGLLTAVAEELGGVIDRHYGHHQLQKIITKRLIELTAEGKRVVLCMDEAQAMPLETLESLRLLTNLETEKNKLMQVVLFAQPELNDHLNRREVRQLKQRITFSYNLDPIDREGIDSYVSHRLVTAGYQGGNLFVASALQKLHKSSRGIPRLINILSHKSMMVAYGKGDDSVTKKHILIAVKDTDDAQLRPHFFSNLFFNNRWFTASILIAVCAGAIYPAVNLVSML
ncbi:MAG: AAA family ATPase [Gammaproteobacteria bacterium]|nr:AAA family ATPase [Gammaproteobacteria bacterium]